MSKIYLFEVEEMISDLEKKGEVVSSGTHAIYAGEDTNFDSGLYPLEIITTYNMPTGTACIISRKVEESN